MAYSRRSEKAIFIDQEALSTLALVQEGLLHPVDGLMNEKTSEEVNRTKCYKGHSFPFSFILAPKGRRNEEVLKSLKSGEIVDLFVDSKPVGWIEVDEVFKIDPEARVQEIYGTQNASHPGVRATMKRLGHYAVSGKYHVEYPGFRKIKEQIMAAKTVSGRNRPVR